MVHYNDQVLTTLKSHEPLQDICLIKLFLTTTQIYYHATVHVIRLNQGVYKLQFQTHRYELHSLIS